MKYNAGQLPEEEIRVILRAADTIIASGGRTLLAKILKGSREKKVLALELDKCPSYGFFRSEKLENVIEKIDWMIDFDFLDTKYRGKLPMIVFTERGWKIESDQLTDELLHEWDEWLEHDRQTVDMNYLKDRNREMILLLLDKVSETGETKYIPYLKAWEEIDYKKVRARIREIISALESSEPINLESAEQRKVSIQDALQGEAPQDILLKCWECGERFTFRVGEQRFYKQKGFVYPKRCTDCRDKIRYGDFL
ncbi:superfamily II DNA helicase [Virgibacillus phasianinus]|uniref:Superfamily II DNA helicase n=1 Tax=Virgibacillus phasianinus TaxID=2017483 RepID=A0A220TYH5_9BACI|nr:RQC-minor-1 family DNA-binding protein [Virgibacillus phasianinus]ASK60766.1 superfamily II DNA helicase [Virgibacillus phasianinus]